MKPFIGRVTFKIDQGEAAKHGVGPAEIDAMITDVKGMEAAAPPGISIEVAAGDDVAPTLAELQAEHAEFCNVAFPGCTRAGIISHLRRELIELETTVLEADEAEEIADCLLLVVSYATVAGVDLAEAVARKRAINAARKWTPVEGGESRHVTTEEVCRRATGVLNERAE